MIEKNVLLPLVEEFIKNKCVSVAASEDDEKLKLKSFIKKDENKCYSIFDAQHSIKCVFDNKFLDDYLAEQPSHVKFESFEIIKNLNKTISLRTVLYVQEFEIDVAQKSKDKNIKKNVNTHPEVVKLLREFFYSYSKDMISSNYKFSNIKAENFQKHEFPIATSSDHYSSKNNSFFKIFENNKNNFLLNTGISLENDIYLHESYSFKETNQEYSSENINIEDLLKIDFKKIFYKQPSQVELGRTEGDLSLSASLAKDENRDLEGRETVTITSSSEAARFLKRKTHRGDPEVEEKRKKLLDE